MNINILPTHSREEIIKWVKKITGKRLNPDYFKYAKKSGVYCFYIFRQKESFYTMNMEQWQFKLYYIGDNKFKIFGENVSGKKILH